MKDDPKVLLRVAHVLKNRGDYDGAAMLCKKVLELNPNHREGMTLLGIIMQEKGNLMEAADTYENQIRLYPEAPEGYYGLAHLYRGHGNRFKAAELFAKAAYLAPDRPEYQKDLAEAYIQVGMQDRALEALSRCKEIDPSDVFGYMKSGEIHLGKKDWMEAAREFGKVLSLQPEHPEAAILFLQAQSRIP